MVDVGGWQNFFLIYTALCCVVPMLALGVGLFIAYRQGSSFINNIITPDDAVMDAQFHQMREQNPDMSTDELVQRFIRRQSLRCGIIGGVLGVPGLPTLPITLPLDMIASYRIQATMVNFIAEAYEHKSQIPGEKEVVSQIVMFGNTQITQTTGRAATKAITNVIGDVSGRFLAKLVPLAGAIVGFAVNYLTTQATGRMAASIYSGQVQTAAGRAGKLLKRGEQDDSEQNI